MDGRDSHLLPPLRMLVGLGGSFAHSHRQHIDGGLQSRGIIEVVIVVIGQSVVDGNEEVVGVVHYDAFRGGFADLFFFLLINI